MDAPQLPDEYPIGKLFAVIVKEPRQRKKCIYPLEAIFVIALMAILAGCNNWSEAAVYGEAHAGFFKDHFKLPRTPSHDTFSRVFRRLDPAPLEHWLRAWLSALASTAAGRVIAIDGKTIRGSFDEAGGKAALHMVNAWGADDHLVLGQLTTAEKSNEITAVPHLIKTLNIVDAIVTVDAMGCQREHAKLIVDRGGDYMMTVKGNQPSLQAAIEDIFKAEGGGLDQEDKRWQRQTAAASGKGHGRIEMRRLVSSVELTGTLNWPNAAQVFRVERVRTEKGRTTREVQYGVTSLTREKADAKRLLAVNRAHWGVENQLHWRLDVVFGEDGSRIRKDHGPENIAKIRRLGLTLLQHAMGPDGRKASIPCKRIACTSPAYAIKVLLNPALYPAMQELST